MITYNGKELRNLEEQVRKNKEDIARHYQATQLPVNLAGITVIGSITDPAELDDKVGEMFGDAYVQVVGDDTKLWIWTRSNPDAGEDNDYWLDIPFTTIGEQGAPGPKGDKGDPGVRGSQWFSGTGQPTTTSGYNVGDYYINVETGNIWHLHTVGGKPTWLLEGNIMGPQGPQGNTGAAGPTGPRGPAGPQGRQGNPGQTVHILGTIESIDQLPDPSTVERNGAYLLTRNNELYVVSGTDTLSWLNVGPLNAGTIVSVHGSYTPTFDADVKLDNMDNKTGDYWTKYNKFFDRFYPLVEVSAAGIKNYTWKKAINRSQGGLFPEKNDWSKVQRGDPVVRMAGGNILLPFEIEGGNSAVSANWVLEHCEESKPFYYYMDGYLTLPTPVDAYKGYFGYPDFFDAEGLESITTQLTDSNLTLYIADCSGGISYEAETFYDIIDSDGDISPIVASAVLRIDDKYYNVKYMGYYYDEDSGTETFRITAINNAEQITLFYYFYSGTGEEGQSLEEFSSQSTLRIQYY